MVGSCSKNDRVRTSSTTASRVMPECRACRQTSGSTVGGRLSTTYQPRSSKVFAAVDRPAPDMPVTTTSRSGDCSARRPPVDDGSRCSLLTSSLSLLTSS